MIPKRYTLRTALLCAATLLASGCTSKKDASKANFESAINTYYSAHPECLWPEPVKFPTHFDTADTEKTDGYDALTDQGLLTRIQDTHKVFLFGSKQVSNYDLSEKGRNNWTADPQQPGFGNFCFGHRSVTSIDNFSSSATSAGASVTAVDYHFKVTNTAPWADNEKVKGAFPVVLTDLSTPQADKATLTLTESGWLLTRN